MDTTRTLRRRGESPGERFRAQFGRPSGLLGWLIGHAMGLKNAERSRWALRGLAPVTGERILEIGFGSGADVARLLSAVGPTGTVSGVDASALMVRQASRRNRRAVVDGRAVLLEGSVERLPFADAAFDAIHSVNSAQFWPGLEPGLRELWRVARPGARALLAVQPMQRGAARADSERWLERLDEAAQSAGWRVRERLLGPQRTPVAAVWLDRPDA